MLEEFKKFALRGNVIDLAIGVVIGGAFGVIVTSLVANIIMPPIGLLLGGVNFENLIWVIKAGNPPPPYVTPADAAAAGAVSINYGLFFSAIISFLIIAWVIFLLVKAINRLSETGKKPETPAEPTEKECPFCAQQISIKASRCPFCTSQLAA
jgi:large conductance mechanosensitive channel